MLSPAAALRLRELPAPSSVILLAGPEGGLTPEEQQLAQLFGFRAVRLGPRILRTETAALAAVSAMHALWGDF
jgi:16S rRNA (uracil1498-N3)-methyltransferase